MVCGVERVAPLFRDGEYVLWLNRTIILVCHRKKWRILRDDLVKDPNVLHGISDRHVLTLLYVTVCIWLVKEFEGSFVASITSESIKNLDLEFLAGDTE